MNYRRKWGTQVWHSSPGCPNWPHSALAAEERDEKPSGGEFCPDCQGADLGADAVRGPDRDQ